MKVLYIVLFLLFAACGDHQANQNTTQAPGPARAKNAHNPGRLTNHAIKFLWRNNRYDAQLKDSFSSIGIDEAYCKTITDAERAALGYVATFIGNECAWDGDCNDDRSNLKCKILTALNLGYQCSATHLGFLRSWFKNDKQVLDQLQNCPTTPATATIQDTFDEITITASGNNIWVYFKASGVNVREGETWSWTETDYFRTNKGNIKLVKTNKSKVAYSRFNNGE